MYRSLSASPSPNLSHPLGQYLVSLCVRRDFGGVAGVGIGGFTVHLLKQRVRLSMETAALVTLLYAGAIPPAAFSSLRFAHRSLLQEFRNPQFAIRDSYTCLLALRTLR